VGSPKDHLTHLPVVGWRRVVHQEQKPVLRTRHALLKQAIRSYYTAKTFVFQNVFLRSPRP
jgi:hypothetical protein